MKKVKLLLLSLFLIPGLGAQDIPGKHDWSVEYDRTKDYIKFISQKKAPYPYSSAEEPQAIIYFSGTILETTQKNDLTKFVDHEIARIKNELMLDTYLETDETPKDNIVTIFDQIDNVEIAILKYRFREVKIGPVGMIRNTRQVLFVYNDKLWISSLIVLYDEDQENMRSDQMSFIKNLITKK